MNRIWGKVYSTTLLFLFLGAEFALAFFAWKNLGDLIGVGVACVFALLFAPTVHELGHCAFASANGFQIKYVKFFCFRVCHDGKHYRFSFANPFAMDETQVLPRFSGNMKKRASRYAVGGLVFGGALFFLLLLAAVLVWVVAKPSFFLLGLLPYAGYMFLLNLPPFEYPSGKTDTLVLRGIRREEPAEKTMVYAMEIQGKLSEGKSFAEIEEEYYFNLPQLAEDEPTYAMILFLRYRYYLENGNMQKAADCLDRLASASPYLSEGAQKELAAELTYMHSLNANKEAADECGALCQEFLKAETATARRTLAAYSLAFGEKEKTQALLAQGRSFLENEEIAGVRRFEEVLLSRLEEKLNKE